MRRLISENTCDRCGKKVDDTWAIVMYKHKDTCNVRYDINMDLCKECAKRVKRFAKGKEELEE